VEKGTFFLVKVLRKGGEKGALKQQLILPCVPVGVTGINKRIRVSSKEELKERILKGVREINSSPVVFCWKKFDLEIT